MIRKDLNSQNQYDAGVTLSGLACFINVDLARDLANDLMTLVWEKVIEMVKQLNNMPCFAALVDKAVHSQESRALDVQSLPIISRRFATCIPSPQRKVRRS